jgi:hypothetical protein
MANGLFDHGRNEFLVGDLDWLVHDIKMILVDAADKDPDQAVDDNLDDISGVSGAVVATTPNFGTKTAVAGVADAADATFSSVTGDVSEELVIYYDSGNATTSTLIVCIDTATGLAVTPNGGDITVQWDSGANKIFKL